MLLILPTDTLFGIFSFFSDVNLEKIFILKLRVKEKKLCKYMTLSLFKKEYKTSLDASILNYILRNYSKKTFLIPTSKSCEYTTNQGYEGIRIINIGIFKKLCKTRPLYGTSANISGDQNNSYSQIKSKFKFFFKSIIKKIKFSKLPTLVHSTIEKLSLENNKLIINTIRD